LIGYARAKEYLFTGDPLTGAQAHRSVSSIMPCGRGSRQRGRSICPAPGGSASRAIQWTKLSVNIGLKALATSILDASIAYEALSNHTKDHQEAVNAFREKRPPRFTGE